MPDPSLQLQEVYLAGFELRTFERYPRAVGVVRGECLALLLPLPDGLQIIGMPGWLIGDELGVMTEKDGQPVFQWKNEVVPATPERLEAIRQFGNDLLLLIRKV